MKGGGMAVDKKVWPVWLKRVDDGRWIWCGADESGEWETVPFQTIDDAVKAYKKGITGQ
jgi:hypothetical protein